LACIATGNRAFAQASLAKLQAEYKSVYRNAKDSVMVVSHQPLSQIDVGNPLQASSTATQFGTGWVYADQYLVTSAENAFGPAARASQTTDWEKALRELKIYYAITAEGETHECTVAGFDIASLTLVLKLPKSANLKGLALADHTPVIGTTVAALGNSFNSVLADGEVSFSVGSLSDAYRMEPVGLTDTTDEPGDAYRGTMLEFEGAANPG
jgi:S1-C subfamily serine protease